MSEEKILKVKGLHSENAPEAIGAYSQAVSANGMLYISGQIPLDPINMTVVEGSFTDRINCVLANLQAICEAAGTNLNKAVKLSVFLTDLQNFDAVNQAMSAFLIEPFPARAVVQVSALPKGVDVEIDAIVAI